MRRGCLNFAIAYGQAKQLPDFYALLIWQYLGRCSGSNVRPAAIATSTKPGGKAHKMLHTQLQICRSFAAMFMIADLYPSFCAAVSLVCSSRPFGEEGCIDLHRSRSGSQRLQSLPSGCRGAWRARMRLPRLTWTGCLSSKRS